ncbi:hypothetical protein [Flavobacterium rhizosphaerae]|uniref:Por secretion system C-terminal sorting domain-containing protein n=1 Tax=Flavobacterium rhizosphaerae TaxID=3163298 RepID=A0ABW8YZQ7_9FLAO
MKNLMKFCLALAVFFTVAAANAGENSSIRVKEGMGKVISFTMDEVANVHVAIYNAEGNELFAENLQSKEGKAINRTYDLTAFPEGTYFIETETGSKVLRHEVVINSENAVVSEKTSQIYKPVVTKDDKGIITLNIFNAEKTPVQIIIYDENNTELYNEKVAAGETKLTKRFDVSKINAKNFTLVTKYNNKLFTEAVAAR